MLLSKYNRAAGELEGARPASSWIIAIKNVRQDFLTSKARFFVKRKLHKKCGVFEACKKAIGFFDTLKNITAHFWAVMFLRLSKKYYFFDKGVCGLTAAHALSAGDGRRARLQAEKYFLRRTCRRRKWLDFLSPCHWRNSTRFFESWSGKEKRFSFPDFSFCKFLLTRREIRDTIYPQGK